ncbi:hypothetical protein M8J76_011414 [Diaphorina citri]|nr:hypothetical protein M8J76_011414 [Diaphorina citri]
MEDILTPPDTPENTKSSRKSVKYSTLPGASSLAVISNEKTNLKFGSVFSLSSQSDQSEKSPRKTSISSPEEKQKRRRFSFLSDKTEKLARKLSISSEKLDKKSAKQSTEKVNEKPVKKSSIEQVNERGVDVEFSTSAPLESTTSKKSPLKFKLLKKLSFSKKPKTKEESSEDTMDGKNGGKSKKKGGKTKFKKIVPVEPSALASPNAIPDTPPPPQNSKVFLEKEREVKEREGEQQEGGSVTSSPSITPTPPTQSDTSLLSTPAQSQDLDSATDNDETYDTPMGTSPNSSVMNQAPGDSDQDLDVTLKENTELPSAAAASDVKSPSDLKKEILSITTPIVTEAGRKKHNEPKPFTSPNSSSNGEKETAASPNTSVVAGKTSITNGSSKEVSPYSKMPDKREFLYKILVIGELGAGKTSIIKRYVHQFFSPHYRATIGVDFALKVLSWDQETIIRLQLWDIAGQERFGNMTRVYYKEAVGAFIVFDVTRAATFDAVLKWKQDLDAKVTLPDGNPIPCVLLANKCDQPKEGIANNPAKIDEFIKEHNFSGWFETSAKDNINIDDAAKTLVQKILENDKVQANGDSHATSEAVFSLNRNSQETKNGRNCAC